MNVKNSVGQTPLFCACFEGHESMVELLIKYGADPNECVSKYIQNLITTYQSYNVYLDTVYSEPIVKCRLCPGIALVHLNLRQYQRTFSHELIKFVVTKFECTEIFFGYFAIFIIDSFFFDFYN